MDLDKLINTEFLKSVDAMNVEGDLKSSIMHHERKRLFLDNVKKELTQVRALRLKAGKAPLKEDTYKWCVKGMTEMFVQTVKKHADIKVKSDAEKTRLKSEVDNAQDIENTLQGKPTGDFADIVQAVGDGDAMSKVNVTD